MGSGGPRRSPRGLLNGNHAEGQTISMCCEVTTKPVVKMWESKCAACHSLIQTTCSKPNNAAARCSGPRSWDLKSRSRPTEPVTARPLWRTVWCPRPSIEQEVSWKGCNISLWGWVVSQAEHHRCRERPRALCDSLVEHVFPVHSTQSWMITTYTELPKLYHVRRPQSALRFQGRRVMLSSQHNDNDYISLFMFPHWLSVFFPHCVCVWVHQSVRLT